MVWVATNRKEAGVRTRARARGIEESHLTKSEIESGKLLSELQARGIDWVALAGFLIKVPSDVCAAFEGRMVNIHPSLLPKHGGEGMYGMHVHRAVKEAGDDISGMTVHFVNDAYDEGNIVFQGEVNLAGRPSRGHRVRKFLTLEHRHYPQVLEGLIRLADGRDVKDPSHLKSHLR